MKKFLIILLWLISLILVSVHVYENPEKMDALKYFFKDKKNLVIKPQEGEIFRKPGNSFIIEYSIMIPFDQKKTSFIYHDEKILDFNQNALKIYFQNGDVYESGKLKKINLPKSFTETKNGGIKGIFIYKNNEFGLMSSLKNGCYYASVVLLSNGKELFKTKCLPDKKVDFNGLGSSHIHNKDKIFFSLGTPEKASYKIRQLAQNKNSMYGKILEIGKDDLDKIIEDKKINLDVKIFSSGHRVPQGFTKINDSFFSTEHGPKGGDELNKIIKDKNYGWPKVSYGTQYFYDEEGKAYEINHERNQFEEPLFALVPSIGISALNTCPSKLKEYYKKPCLLALSLFGNSLRPGKSIIIYLLNEKMDKVQSIEIIYLRDDLKLRHFVTNSKNELYEDVDGNIYVSADGIGIYKLSFVYFRN